MTHLLITIAWTLIHFCWQAAAIAALYGASTLVLARRSSQTRYLCALAALLAMMAAAAGTFAWQAHRQWAEPENVQAMAGPGGPLHNEIREAMATRLGDGAMVSAVKASATESMPTVLPWVDGFWLLGVFLLSVRTLGGWWMLRRLSARVSLDLPDAVLESFNALVDALGLRRPVRLVVSRTVGGPLTVGFLRATVLLPLSAITALGPDELQVVLAHELAHVRRADFLWNLVQTFAETVFFFHPAVWWIGSCLRNERELCCDDLALKLCPNPVVYASALFRLEQHRAGQPRMAMALDGNQPGSSLRFRILRILGEPVTQMGRGPSRAFSVAVGLAGLLLLILPTSQVLAGLHPVHAAVVVTKKPICDADVTPAIATDQQPIAVEQPVLAAVSTELHEEVAPRSTPRVEAAVSAGPIIQDAVPAAEKPRAGTPAGDGKSSYIDRMRAAGYDVELDKYVAMKIQGVTPEYAREMAAGFGKLSADDLIACKIQGVSPETIRQMKQQGLDFSDVHEAISFRIFSVTPEFIAGMKAAGFSNLSAQQLIGLRVQGVTPEYARSIAQQYPGATAEDLVKTKIFHIDADFLERARQHGFNNLKLEKLVQLRIAGLLDEDK